MKNEMLAVLIMGLFIAIFDTHAAEARPVMETDSAEKLGANGLAFSNLQIGLSQPMDHAPASISVNDIMQQLTVGVLDATITDFAKTTGGKDEKGLSFVAATKVIVASARQGQSISVDHLSQLVRAAQPFLKDMTSEELASFKAIVEPFFV